jgi:hypothetical protein
MPRRIPPFAVALAALCLASSAEENVAPPAQQLTLVRYDLPLGISTGFAPTRQAARRADGTDAVDWPVFTLNGGALWADRSDAAVPLAARRGEDARSYFRSPGDDVIEPGGHWLRFIEWPRGRSHIYTADRTARTAASGPAGSGAYELWAFPIVVKGEGGPVVKNVELKLDGRPIYSRAGPWRSLTLLLPANERGHLYELTVDGRGPVKFDAGLVPVKLGDPHERVIRLEAALPGDGPKIVVRNLERPEEFPHAREWAADVAALAWPRTPAVAASRGAGLESRVGVEVPRSPLTIYATAVPGGKCGGFFRKGDQPDAFAEQIAATGLDTVFESVAVLPAAEDAASVEQRAAALARRGVRLGLHFDRNATRPSFQDPNLALFAHTLPDWHAPLYRSVSLVAQRFARLPNFVGIEVGGALTGDAPVAFPSPDRPWGEAMIELAGGAPPASGAELLKYARRFETAFRQYGYFAEAVRAVDPHLVFTTASFSQARGGGAVSGREMFEGLSTQQAFDVNDGHAARPLLNVALTDRLHSDSARTRTWSLLDNYRFLHGREAWQRACALALTRGIQGLGTNFIPNGRDDTGQAEIAGWQREMNDWMHRYGGVFARTEPAPVIGIFYSHQQALLRRVPPEQLPAGSHEGKVVEALFICHAAGWPARVITFPEMMRGPLPPAMKAIVLTGLDRPDAGWSWSEGLEPVLQQFVARGGRILLDDESVCPAETVSTGMKVVAEVGSTDLDPTPQLFARNAGNIAKLREAMRGVAEPVAVSDAPTVWAIPAEAGDTQYVTVVNQGFAEGEEAGVMLRPVDPKATRAEVWKTKANASLYVKPQQAALRWHTDRPIYDVRLRREVTAEEAARVDLTQDAFRWYALPPAAVVAPEIALAPGVSGFYEATPTMRHGVRMDGIPVEITVKGANETATVFASTGRTVRLPLNERVDRGDFTIIATELLTGLSASAELHLAAPAAQTEVAGPVTIREPAVLARFAARKAVPLIIALTPEQRDDATIAGQARALAEYYRQQGRVTTRVGLAAPDGVVTSLQVLKSPHRFPHWQTIPADLVLFGTPADNVLLLDQARGEILPLDLARPKPGEAQIVQTRSAFCGECDVLNVIAGDAAGITAAVQSIIASARTASR